MSVVPTPRLIMHTIAPTPINPGGRVLCVDTGARPPPLVVEIAGRRCYQVGDAQVSRLKQGRTSYSVVFVRYLDDGSPGRFTGAVWARKARLATPQPGDPT